MTNQFIQIIEDIGFVKRHTNDYLYFRLECNFYHYEIVISELNTQGEFSWRLFYNESPISNWSPVTDLDRFSMEVTFVKRYFKEIVRDKKLNEILNG